MNRSHKLSTLCALTTLVLAPHVQAQLEPQPGERELLQEQLVPRLLRPPTMTKQVEPDFPEEEKERGGAGSVVMRLTLDEGGLIDRVEVLQSATPAFDWSAMGAATNLEFTPAIFAMQPAEGEPRPPCTPLAPLPGQEPASQPASAPTDGAAPEPEPEPEAPTGPCADIFVSPVQLDYRMGFELQASPEPPPPKPKPPVARVTGIVREAGSKKPLEGVEILVELGELRDEWEEGELPELSALTDIDGVFTFPELPRGTHKIRLALSSYEAAVEEEEFEGDQEVQAIYYLVKRSYSKFTTVVRVKRPPKEVTKVALSREEVEKVPGTFGDPLRVIENLPGLARAGVIGGALLVRGANPGDSGVYYDSVAIPILYHFGGLTSVINAEFLEDIDFYPGGFGARYGRATAGIVDVSSRDLDMDTFRGTGELDLLDSGFFFAGPIDIGQIMGKEPAPPGPSPQKITFAAAARRSYVDALLPFVIEALLPPSQAVLTASPIYWDYQVKVEYRPHKDHRMSIMGFGSDDNLKILAKGAGEEAAEEINLGVNQNFHRLLLRYDANLSRTINNRFVAYGGYTGFSFGGDAQGTLSGGGGADNWETGFRDELTINPFDKVELALGVDVLYGSLNFDFTVPFAPSVNSYPRILPNLSGETSLETEATYFAPAYYVETRLGPWAGVTLIPGFRFDHYAFGEDQERFTAEPRLTARWQVFEGTTLKGAIGVYEQLPDTFQLGEDFGNPDLDLPRAMHYIVGYEHRLTEKLNLSVEMFFNDKDRLVVNSDAGTVGGGGEVDLEFYNNDGIGRAYGIEVLLRHDLSKDFFGWIAYTLSRSENRSYDPGFRTSRRLGAQQGADPWVLSGFDQTHILTLVGQYRPPSWDAPSALYSILDGDAPPWLVDGWRVFAKDWSIGARFRLVTGDPSTPVLYAEHDLDTDDWDARRGAQNTTRQATFNQLDIRVDRKVVFESFVLNFYLDLLNAYNMANVESIVNDYRFREDAPLTGLPIIPVIGVQGEF